MLIMFSAFIFLCGIGHLLDIVTLWFPIYWISAIEDVATALISLATFLLLPFGIAATPRRRIRRPAGRDPALSSGNGEGSSDRSTVSTTGAVSLSNVDASETDADREPPGGDQGGQRP
jgi:hypothetical protein